ncbi:hypothetical protein [Nocardia neocaledoniensis]|uniref:hypothetical protein n=1 Tax=Nocardia neocaledoniensis TaxID=236511 RepID=UPI002457E5AC|nr:hypothetical protein [Nocardia neocaledoniensis]
MKTTTTSTAGLRRLLLSAAVVGAAATFPLTMATPATALPAAAPAAVHTSNPRCDDWNKHRDWDYCDRDRGHRCDHDKYGRNHWNDRDWEYCDRDRGRGGHHWFPWGWFGSS